jgi:hypothetical protein
VCQQQLGHRQAALRGGAAQGPHAAGKRMCDVVEDEPKRTCLAARDRVLYGCDIEDVDRRIGRLGKAGIGHERSRAKRGHRGMHDRDHKGRSQGSDFSPASSQHQVTLVAGARRTNSISCSVAWSQP